MKKKKRYFEIIIYIYFIEKRICKENVKNKLCLLLMILIFLNAIFLESINYTSFLIKMILFIVNNFVNIVEITIFA